MVASSDAGESFLLFPKRLSLEPDGNDFVLVEAVAKKLYKKYTENIIQILDNIEEWPPTIIEAQSNV